MNKKSSQLINGIASSINGLILNKDLNVALYNTLRNLGESLETGACYIFVNDNKAGDRVIFPKYSWTAFGTHSYLQSEMPIPQESIVDKIKVLEQSKIFEAKYSNAYEFTLMDEDRDKPASVITFPIFVDEEFWGFLEVRDCDSERDWSSNEKNILQIVTTSIGGAIERKNLEDNLEKKVLERTQELNKSKTYLSLAIEAFDLGMWIYDVEQELIRFNKRQAEIYELDNIGEPDENDFYTLNDVQVFIKKWSPDHEDLSEETYADIIKGKQPYLVERKLLTKAGTDRYILSKGVGILDDQSTKIIGLTVDLTERKLEELELRRSNTKYTLATRTTAMGIWDWNLSDNILDWDEGMYKLYDVLPKDFSGAIEAWEACLFEEDKEFAMNEVNLVIEGSKELDMEFRIKKKQGKVSYIRSCAKVYRDDDGKAVRMIGLNWDITEQKEVELALRASEEKFRELYHRTPAMLHSIDGDGRLVSVSDYWLKHLGYTRQSVVGSRSIDYLTPESKEFALNTAIPDFYKKGYANNVPYEFLNANGEIVHVLLSAISQIDDAGNFNHSFAVLTDITERVMAEKALRISHEKFKSLIKNIPGIVYTAEYPSFKMVFISEYCEQIIGYSLDRFHDREDNLYLSLIHQDDVLERDETIQQSLERKESFRIQYRLIVPSGKIKWVSEFGHGIYDEKGELIEIEGSVFDITDKVKSEEKILSAVMQTADRERSRISAEIHDSLQQTLTISSLNFEYIGKNRKGFSKSMNKKYLTGLKYLRKALDQTRSIAHGLMPKAIEDFGFIEVVHDMAVELNRTTTTKFSFLTNIDGFCFAVMTEATLYKIVQEAVNNIIKHAKAKHVTIQFLMREDNAQLSIEDDGEGFSLNDVDMNISGFGLVSMKNRAAALHGSFHIDARPGRGTSIFIEIPIEQN